MARHCPVCREPIPTHSRAGAYHHGCEPTLCTCRVPNPDAGGECRRCHRPDLDLPWAQRDPTNRNNVRSTTNQKGK
jgi:hypothetical protein